MRKITCVNHSTGNLIKIGEDSFSPFFLAHLDGVYSSEFDVAISDNTLSDGGTYQGSRKKVRNIVITALDQPNNVYNQNNRDLLYTVFRQGETGTLIYSEDDVDDRQIDYEVESVIRESGGHRLFTISLICPNPYFEDTYDTNVYMANFFGAFEFPHNFNDEGEEIGIYLTERLVNIVNDTAASSIGFTAYIRTTTRITNPIITRVESQEHIKVGSSENPFTLSAGQTLVISTGRDNKHVKWVRNGVETEINEYLTEDSDFFTLLTGDNHIVYNASSGVPTMSVLIQYKFQYDGA